MAKLNLTHRYVERLLSGLVNENVSTGFNGLEKMSQRDMYCAINTTEGFKHQKCNILSVSYNSIKISISRFILK